jgi:hypothetical protein
LTSRRAWLLPLKVKVLTPFLAVFTAGGGAAAVVLPGTALLGTRGGPAGLRVGGGGALLGLCAAATTSGWPSLWVVR